MYQEDRKCQIFRRCRLRKTPSRGKVSKMAQACSTYPYAVIIYSPASTIHHVLKNDLLKNSFTTREWGHFTACVYQLKLI